MAEWIKRGERVTVVSFTRSFEWANTPGAGFGFECDEQGNLLTNEAGENVNRFGEVWHPAASANYQMCLTGEDPETGEKIIDKGVARYENSYWEPGVIRCDRCSAEVVLDMVMTNTCEACVQCGQIESFGWHTMTAEVCEAFMQQHEGRGCANPSEHHEYHPCAADYNSFGQRLAPREQWGWDTGESLGEILASDWPIDTPREAWIGDDF